jgi:hypothetical protein
MRLLILLAGACVACRPEPPAESRTDTPSALGRELARSAALDTAARRILDFLKDRATFDRIALADSVTLYVAPEGGGGRATFTRGRLRDPGAWVVRSAGRRVSFIPPAEPRQLTTKAGRHFTCREYPLDSRVPHRAGQPHVGVKLEPPNPTSCLQSWNVTFVFDTSTSPRLIAAVYDQWEW